MECKHCGTHFDGRKRKYCTKTCSRRATRDNPNATCTTEGCNRPRRAKGLCATHYNAATRHTRNEHIETPCDVCGTPVRKERRTHRYQTLTCANPLCRHWAWSKTGRGWATTLPRDHWARWYGATCDWKPTRHTLNCAWCDKEFTTNLSFARFCGTTCASRHKHRLRRAHTYNAPGEFKWGDVVKLWAAFDKKCAYCLNPVKLNDVQAEHVHPLSKGGRNDLGNILPSCGPCNSDKRDLLLPEWARDRARRNLPPVNTQWADNDTRYAHIVSPQQEASQAS